MKCELCDSKINVIFINKLNICDVCLSDLGSGEEFNHVAMCPYFCGNKDKECMHCIKLSHFQEV